ncbi:MAG: hypothetical protein ACI8XM_000092 [Haloarculaceae archaeon]|jgi:hypothetical protein
MTTIHATPAWNFARIGHANSNVGEGMVRAR